MIARDRASMNIVDHGRWGWQRVLAPAPWPTFLSEAVATRDGALASECDDPLDVLRPH